MKLESNNLIDDLIRRTKENLNNAEALKQEEFRFLNHKADNETWSVLECIEHLNLYGDFYMPEIRQSITNSKYKTPAPIFISGRILGNYFANSMLPKEKLNKMKTFKDKNPAGSNLSISTLNKFINQQKETLDLLDLARKVDLNKTKTSISITKLLKLKLGDTFRVIIYHNQRHLVQAKKALANAKN